MVVNYSSGPTSQPTPNSVCQSHDSLTYTLTQITPDRTHSLHGNNGSGNGATAAAAAGVMSVRGCGLPSGGGVGVNGARFHTSAGYDVKVMRESPSSSGDFSAKFNQLPVSPYAGNHFHLSVPTQETMS